MKIGETPVEPAVVVDDLVVTRGKGKARKEILHGISCELPTGSITGLLGPSGCGKTTLIRTVVGAQRITSGSVRVLGEPAGTPRLRRLVSYTSQNLSIYPDISVADNVTYFARLAGRVAPAWQRLSKRWGLTSNATSWCPRFRAVRPRALPWHAHWWASRSC